MTVFEDWQATAQTTQPPLLDQKTFYYYLPFFLSLSDNIFFRTSYPSVLETSLKPVLLHKGLHFKSMFQQK